MVRPAGATTSPRKAILAGLLNKMDDYTAELSALLSAEQNVTPAEARWEIDLLTKAFGFAIHFTAWM